MYTPVSQEVERLLLDLRRRLGWVESRLNQVQQNNNIQWGTTWTSSSSTVTGYWAHAPGGGIAGASGAFPTITPTAVTLDVYSDVGGTLTAFATSQTCRWWYKDACGANKLLALASNGDGTFDILVESCTVPS